MSTADTWRRDTDQGKPDNIADSRKKERSQPSLGAMGVSGEGNEHQMLQVTKVGTLPWRDNVEEVCAVLGCLCFICEQQSLWVDPGK